MLKNTIKLKLSSLAFIMLCVNLGETKIGKKYKWIKTELHVILIEDSKNLLISSFHPITNSWFCFLYKTLLLTHHIMKARNRTTLTER